MITQEQVSKLYPDAYNALPECYQADHSLHFYTENGELFAQHTYHAETYIWSLDFLEWLMVYDPIPSDNAA